LVGDLVWILADQMGGEAQNEPTLEDTGVLPVGVDVGLVQECAPVDGDSPLPFGSPAGRHQNENFFVWKPESPSSSAAVAPARKAGGTIDSTAHHNAWMRDNGPEWVTSTPRLGRCQRPDVSRDRIVERVSPEARASRTEITQSCSAAISVHGGTGAGEAAGPGGVPGAAGMLER
jgi:hypothetical protein